MSSGFTPEQLRALRKRTYEALRKGIDWSDIGFTEAEEIALNLEQIPIRKEIFLTMAVDPASNPMDLQSSTDVDPTFGDRDAVSLPFTATKFSNLITKTLHAVAIADAAVSTFMTFEDPDGTDYSVPSNKVFRANRVYWLGSATNAFIALGYGDNGVAAGTTAPTNEVITLGNTGTTLTVLTVQTISLLHQLALQYTVPAGKFPHVRKSGAQNNNVAVYVMGVEYNA